MALSWWDEKLKNIPKAASAIPNYCVSLDYDSGIALTSVNSNYQSFHFKQQKVLSGLSGLTELIMEPVDNIIDLFRFNYDDEEKEITTINREITGGTFRPLFIPFKQAKDSQIVFGTPRAQLNVSYDEDQTVPLLYVGLGKKKSGQGSIELVNHQLSSLTSNNTHNIELPTISTNLEKGDTLGLLVYGYHAHYMFRSPFWPTMARIEGSVDVPFHNRTN